MRWPSSISTGASIGWAKTTSARVCGPLSLQLRPPDRQLFQIAAIAAMVSEAARIRAWGRRRGYRGQAKVIVGIALADVDGLERLARRRDGLGHGPAIGQGEATVHQDGVPAPPSSTGARAKPCSSAGKWSHCRAAGWAACTASDGPPGPPRSFAGNGDVATWRDRTGSNKGRAPAHGHRCGPLRCAKHRSGHAVAGSDHQ